jgi:hypothetical protein
LRRRANVIQTISLLFYIFVKNWIREKNMPFYEEKNKNANLLATSLFVFRKETENDA